MTKIRFARDKAKRKAPYRDLLKVAHRAGAVRVGAIAFLEEEGPLVPIPLL